MIGDSRNPGKGVSMKARHAVLVALAAAVTLTSVAAARPDAAKQRVAISMKGLENGTFVLTPLQAGTLKRDSGTVRVVFSQEPDVMREGQNVSIYRNTYTLKGKRGSMSIRERAEWVVVSNEKAPGFDYVPGVGIGTWKVVGGTGAYAKITGGGRSGHQGHPEWLARQEGFLTRR
jgi:hypothetical protein